MTTSSIWWQDACDQLNVNRRRRPDQDLVLLWRISDRLHQQLIRIILVYRVFRHCFLMPHIESKLASSEHRIADLEHRIAEQKTRVLRGEGDIVSSISVLELMEQTLESWRSADKSHSGDDGLAYQYAHHPLAGLKKT